MLSGPVREALQTKLGGELHRRNEPYGGGYPRGGSGVEDVLTALPPASGVGKRRGARADAAVARRA